jgi:feruloyl esterase
MALGIWRVLTPVAVAATIAAATVAHAAERDCRSLAAARLSNTDVTVSETDGACRVSGVISPAKSSRIGFQLWLPAASWNGRFLMLGNGGYSSALPLAAMRAHLEAGYAVAATNTGHAGDDPSFARGRPAAIVDWSERAVHLTAVRSKTLVARFYGRPAHHAYFQGCSTGGHQAFMEVQRHPEDFDGIVAGAPGHNRTHLNAGFLWQYLQNHRTGDDAQPIVPAAKLGLLTSGALARCGRQNGASAGGLPSDPYLNDPTACDFDPAVLLCQTGDAPDCLTADQVAAVKRMYGGARNPRTGERIYFGWPFGSERGWGLYWADPANPAAPARASFWRDWAFDPAWSWWRFDFDRDMKRADDALARTINAMSPDLSAFRRRGGKLIHYHGLADPVVPAQDSISYHERVFEKLGPATGGFYRLFLVPGMEHCGGGSGPQPTGLQASIEAWVERGEAPDRLLGRHIQDGSSRPLCPYPAVARYDGRGPTGEAASFACAAPARRPTATHPAPAYLR